jgi:hypothetical protein
MVNPRDVSRVDQNVAYAGIERSRMIARFALKYEGCEGKFGVAAGNAPSRYSFESMNARDAVCPTHISKAHHVESVLTLGMRLAVSVHKLFVTNTKGVEEESLVQRVRDGQLARCTSVCHLRRDADQSTDAVLPSNLALRIIRCRSTEDNVVHPLHRECLLETSQVSDGVCVDRYRKKGCVCKDSDLSMDVRRRGIFSTEEEVRE